MAVSSVEEVIANAEGVVVHSESHAEAVRAHWAGPLASLFLPTYPTDWSADSAQAPTTTGHRQLLLTVGHVNPNKHIHSIVDALATDPALARRVRYVVIGAYDGDSRYFKMLQSRIAHARLESTVELLGYQSDAELERLKAEASVFVNLRHPNLEGGSASLMRQLPAGKPILVYSSGVFAEVPEDAVVRTGLAPEQIASTLTRLLDNPDEATSVGRRGREWVRDLTPERYASRLLAFMDAEVPPVRPVLRLGERVAGELAAFGIDPALPVIDRVAAEIATLVPIFPGVSAVTIRPLDSDDLPQLVSLFTRNDLPSVTENFDPFPLNAASATEALARGRRDRVYGAFYDTTLVAFSMLRGWDEGYDIPSFGILVDAAHHGRGIGTQLTDWTIKEANRLSSPAIRLSVYARNTRAVRIYKRLGFVERTRSSRSANRARRKDRDAQTTEERAVRRIRTQGTRLRRGSRRSPGRR